MEKGYAQGVQEDNNKMEVSNESKIVERKEVLEVSLKKMMLQQIKETELNQLSELNLQSPTVAKKRNNKLTKVDGSRGIKDRSTSMYSHI